MRINNAKKIKKFISRIFEKEKIDYERIDFIFCSDQFLLRLNKNILQHDYYTDILAFELNEKQKPVIGEIYISVDRIRENSKNYSVLLYQEILRVIFHGILHLCGYRDKTRKEKEKMRSMEENYLDSFNSKF
jgi:probable rRNA maturation factor